MPPRRAGIVGYIIIAFLVGILGLFLYDLLFSAPDHRTGVVIEKIFVPARSVTGAAPGMGGMRRGGYSITSQKEEQWIAVVRMENGDTLKVHCHPGQYKAKNVGDVIHFKKYEGKLLHIEYFAHNEEEDD
jgi:hypothetical protein